MTESTYWLAGPTGEKAVVEGGAERDRLFPHGWRETAAPTDGDFVWMSHPEVEKPGLLPWAAREYWQGIGWAPSAPPEPVNPALDPVLTDATGEPASAPPKADSRRTPKTTAAPAAPSKEE
jgi:hypothetical protein